MLERGTGALRDAWSEGWAVPAFSVYDAAQARGVCDAAAMEGSPIILQAGSSAFRGPGRTPLAALALATVHDGPARVGVHLDHSTDLDEIRACLALGYSSIMFDGSALPFDENMRVTREAVVEAHDAGAWVEAELVGYAGDEDRSVAASAPASATDPDQAARFVERTGVDALAVAVGNVHGMAAAPAPLDLDRLAAIRAVVDVPLVLHGASGLPDAEVRAAIALGVAKININTELRRAYLAAARAVARARDDDLAGMLAAATAAVRDVAREKIRVYGGPGRPASTAREVVA
jgi:tagatose 1,6-diphosphate aldolase GatY/KbaY